jgi:ABC-type phosphate/phosphonate transport system substrate-binding protein
VALVGAGRADIAAIDCVTWGYLAEAYPQRVEGVTVIGRSAATPGLPLIAGRLAPPELVARLRAALLSPGQRLRHAMEALRITSWHHLADAAYDRIVPVSAQ